MMPHPVNPHFVGREAVLEKMRRAFHAGDGQDRSLALVQAIHGLGGVGKTQLAIWYAHAHAEEYDGVFWVHADPPERLASDFAELYHEAGLSGARAASDVTEQAKAVRRWLESAESGVWLLIFDNVEDPETLKDYLPTRHRGHVLLTSRRARWDMAAHSLEVREMDRADAIKLLLQRSGQCDKEGAASLADSLGDLPLALAQAGGYLAESGMPFRQYLDLFQARRADLLRRGPCPDGYRLTIFATLDLALSRISSAEAEDMLGFLACLAPDQIPRRLLDGILDDPLRVADGLAALNRHSLIRCSGDAIEVHRLIQAVAWDRMGPEEQNRQLGRAVTLLESRFPPDSQDPHRWRECRSLHPHALQTSRLAEQAKVAVEVTAELITRVGQYEARRGRYREALPILRRALSILRDLYWDNHPRVLRALTEVAEALSRWGDLKTARIGYEFALEHLEAGYGPDHPQVAVALNSLGMIAQECQRALKTGHRWALENQPL